MSGKANGQVLYFGVFSENGPNKTIIASIFGAKSSLNKSATERHFIEKCGQEKSVEGLRSVSSFGVTGSKMWITYEPITKCFIGAAGDGGFQDRLAWAALKDASEEVRNNEEAVRGAAPLGLNKQLRDPFIKIMAGGDDKLVEAQIKIDQTKEKMTDNMEKMVHNYDNLQDLENQVQEMEVDTKQYQNKAKKFQWHTLKEYWYAWAILIAVILIIIIALISYYAS